MDLSVQLSGILDMRNDAPENLDALSDHSRHEPRLSGARGRYGLAAQAHNMSKGQLMEQSRHTPHPSLQPLGPDSLYSALQRPRNWTHNAAGLRLAKQARGSGIVWIDP